MSRRVVGFAVVPVIEVRPRRHVGERVGVVVVLVLLFGLAQSCNRNADGYPVGSPFPRASQSPSASVSVRPAVMGWDTSCVPAAPPGTTCESIGGHR